MLRRRAVYGKKIGFIQNLNTLDYDSGSNAIGMVDAVSGNDTLFKNSYCFKGDGSGYLALSSNVANIYTLNSYRVDVSLVIGGPSGSGVLWGYRSTATPVIQLVHNTASSLQIQYRDSGGSLHKLDAALGAYSDYVDVSFELTDIQTATPTMELLINGAVVDSLIFTKGATLLSSLFTIAGARLPSISNELVNASIFRLREFTNGTEIMHHSLSGEIVNAGTHVSYDEIGTNDGTLTSGALINTALQDYYHYLQTIGGKWDGVNQIVPSLKDGSVPADGIGVNNYVQNGKRWLRFGDTKMQNADVQALKDADIQNIWFDSGGLQKDVTDVEYAAAVSAYPEIYGGNIDSNYIDTLTLK